MDAPRDFYFLFFIFSERAARRGGGRTARLFLFLFFPCSADHERDWPPCKVVFFGLATNALNVRNNNENNNNCLHGTLRPSRCICVWLCKSETIEDYVLYFATVVSNRCTSQAMSLHAAVLRDVLVIKTYSRLCRLYSEQTLRNRVQRFHLYAFAEAAALRSIVLRYAGAPIATRVSLLFLEMSLFPSIFCKALHGRLKSQRDGTGGKLPVDPPFSFRRERGTGKI